MFLRRFTQILLCLAVSIGLTWVATLADHFRQQSTQMLFALKWARQITAQAEGLAYEGRQLEKQDPMGWAADLLSEGTDSRLLTVSKVQSGVPVQTPEIFDLDREKGIFDYKKILRLDDGTGVRVKILVGAVGFLGARTQLTHDLTVVLFALTCFLLLFVFTRGAFGLNRDQRFRDGILRWIKDAKPILAQLGIHIREMIREAQVLAAATGKSRTQVEGLRKRIHAQIEMLHARGKSLSEGEKHAQEKEQLAFLEPCAMDADEALHTFDDVFRATQSMGGYIRKTTETILNHARQVKTLQEIKQDGGEARAPRTRRHS